MSTVSKIVKSIVDAPDVHLFNDATDLQTLITQYEQMLAALKALIAKESDVIRSAGYTAIVQAAITVHQDRINQLKARLAGESVSASDISYLVSQYTNQLDSYAYLGKQLCTGGYVDELSTLLPKYKNVLAALISLNSTSRTAIEQSGYGPIVTGSISLHTIEIQNLEACVPVQLTLPANGIITGCRVNATVDGDTLEVDLPTTVVPAGSEPRVNIRLAGCNAPEKPDSSSQAGKSVLEYTYDDVSSFMYVDKAFYSQATMKLGSLVGGRNVTLKVNKSKPYDSYSRLVAVVVREDGVVANEEMLTAGLCAYFHRSEWNSPDDPVDHSRYIALESAAKVEKVGVWATAITSADTGQCIITAVRPTTSGGVTSITALVYVDNVYMGMTSTTEPFTLSVGDHAIRVVSSQYGIGTSSVTITKNGMFTVNVQVGETTDPENPTEKGYVTFQALRMSTSNDYVGTTAEVWENNRYKFMCESTKDRVSTDVGEHTYTFKKDGYENKEVTVTVEADQEVLAKAILVSTDEPEEPSSTKGTIDFISNPTGARIYVNDEYIGLTKKLDYALSPGVYTVWLKKTGYIDFTQTVLVETGKKEAIDAILSKSAPSTGDPTEEPETSATGTVDFITSPSGAYIYVDNVYIGMTKKSGYKITAGVHLVTFRKNGYNEWEDTVGVTANERIAVEATLQVSDIAEEEEEVEEETETTAGTVNWYNYPNQSYSNREPTGGYTSTTPSFTTQPSPTATSEEPEEDEGMPVQIIVLQEEPDKEALGKTFKEVKKFFKKYCDKKLKFIATTQEPIEPDKDEDGNETLEDINSIEDQLDLDNVQDDKGIIVILWPPSGSSVASKGETLTRDELLNRSIVCTIPLDDFFAQEISGTSKTTLGLTSEGALSMVTTMTNALLEWYLDDHEAEEEDEELPEFDKEFCDIKDESKDRPSAKCAKKWLKKYNKKIEE